MVIPTARSLTCGGVKAMSSGTGAAGSGADTGSGGGSKGNVSTFTDYPVLAAAPLAEIPVPDFIDASSSYDTNITEYDAIAVCMRSQHSLLVRYLLCPARSHRKGLCMMCIDVCIDTVCVCALCVCVYGCDAHVSGLTMDSLSLQKTVLGCGPV